ncbi:MAG TPA: tetratricopeptide repeat protein [Geothrix sp.]|nr:tetratricopeptide repeat protein [Geothrix sp.]
MNRNIMFALVGGVVLGGLVGYYVGKSGAEAEAAQASPAAPTAVVMPAPSLGGGVSGAMPGAMPGAGMPTATLPSAEAQAQINRLEAVVLSDPKNHDAWADLGNLYFDSHQPQKSIDAYGKALALKPNDPNVLTDQGVMYRALGQPEKALANFQKAQKLDPTHMHSLFNIGIVYANDLKKPAEAAKVWNQLIAKAPASDQAAQARQMLGQLKQ